MLAATVISTFFAALPLASAFSDAGNNNVAIYWGQNSAGQVGSQENLGFYCDSDASDVVLVSFLNRFFGDDGLPEINLGPSCGGTTFPNSNLLSCPDVGKDIQTCQGKGKKILLSLGGAAGAYGFDSAQQAKDFADTLWNLFAGGSSDTRPFGDVKVDGFDLDIEGGSNQYYQDFVTQMRSHYAADSSKKYYISGAPQCPLPDQMLNPSITTSDYDLLFIQFYNNYCGLNAYGTDNFNFGAWDQFAKTQSSNKNVKIYLGVPGGPSAAGSGYKSAADVVSIANELQSKYSSFGGVSIWDASQAWKNDDFANVVKRGLGSDPAPSAAPASSAAPAPSASDVVVATSEQNKVVVTTTANYPNVTVTVPTVSVGPTSVELPTAYVTTQVTNTTTVCDSSTAAAAATSAAAVDSAAAADNVVTVKTTATTTTTCDSTSASSSAAPTVAPQATTSTVSAVQPVVTVYKHLPLESCACMAAQL